MVNPAKRQTVELDDSLLRVPASEALAAIESSGDRAIPLVEAWVRTGNAGAVAAVAEHGSGPSRKAARRGLQVLGARGIKIRESAARRQARGGE